MLEVEGNIQLDLLPPTLTYCNIGSQVKYGGEIPGKLKHLRMRREVINKPTIPSTITFLDCTFLADFSSLPSLQTLILGKTEGNIKDLSSSLTLDIIPSSVTNVTILKELSLIQTVPNTVTHLHLPAFSPKITGEFDGGQ